LNTNGDNEDAAVLLGYTYLSAGGVDPFNLARKLITIQAAKAAAATGQTLDDEPHLATHLSPIEAYDELDHLLLADPAAPAVTPATDNTAQTLLQLASIINLSAADFDKLTDPSKTVKDGLFASSPVLVPRLVDEPR